MTRIAVSLLVLAFAVAGLAVTARAQQDSTPSPAPPPAPAFEADPSPVPVCPPDRILVKLRPGADPAAVTARYGGTIVQTVPGIEVQVVTVPAGQGQTAIDALSADPDVQYAEADQIVHTLATDGGC